MASVGASWETGREDDGHAFPGPNAENRAILEEIRRKRKEVSRVTVRRENGRDQARLAARFLRQVRDELENTEALCRAKDAQVQTERHLAAVAQRQAGHLALDHARTQKQLGRLAQRQNELEDQILRAKQKLERFGQRMDWDRRALDAFLEESAQREEHAATLVKYSGQDERRIKSLTLATERTALEAKQRRRALDAQVTENLAAQVALEKTVEHLEQTHGESQKIIRRWEKAIGQSKRRDADLRRWAGKASEADGAVRQRKDALGEMKRLHDSQLSDNKETERKLTATRRRAANLKQDLKHRERNCLEMRDQLKSCKSALDRSTSAAESVKSHVSRLGEQIRQNRLKLERDSAANGALEEKLSAATRHASSQKDKAAQMEGFLAQEERAIRDTDAQLRRRRERLFRCRRQADVLKRTEKDALAQKSRSQSALAALERELGKCDKRLARKRAAAAQKDCRVDFLEKKLARLRGLGHSEEKSTLEAQIAQWNQTLERRTKTSGRIAAGIAETEADTAYLKREKDKSEAEKKELARRAETHKLINDNMDKELKKLGLDKKEQMLERNMLKLEMERKRDRLFSKAHGVHSLEKRRLDVDRALRRRREEIALYRQMLSRELKSAERDRRQMGTRLDGKMSKIHAMKKRFWTGAAVPGGEDEEEEDAAVRLQAGYIAKAALERAEALERGERLAGKIRQLEEENRALENSALLARTSNSQVRAALKPVAGDSSDGEYGEKIQAEERLRLAGEALEAKRKQLRQLEPRRQELNATLDALLQAAGVQKLKLEGKRSLLGQLGREILSQREKVDRATKQCRSLSQKIRSGRKTAAETSEEKDVRLRQLKDLSKRLERLLRHAADRRPDLGALLEKAFIQAKLPFPPPSPSPSTAGSRSSGVSAASRSRTSSAGPGAGASPSLKMVSLTLDVTLPRPLSQSAGGASAPSPAPARAPPRTTTSSSGGSKKGTEDL
ncbi:coiled-coil domain-containing protein 39-like [Stigmatopora nigra]